MTAFLRKYRSLLLVLPVLHVVGNAAAPLALLLFGVFCLMQAARKRHDVLLLTTLVIFILGDSRLWYIQWPKNMRMIILMLMAAITIIDLARGIYKLRPVMWVATVFYLLSIIVSVRNFDPGLSFSKATSYYLLLFVAVHYFNHHVRKQGRVLLQDLFWMVILIVGIGLLLIPLQPNIVFFAESGRYRGLFGNPNGMGVYLTLVTPLVYLHFRIERKPLPLRLFAWGLILFSLFITFSRNGLISVIFFFFLSFLHKNGSLKLRVIAFYLMVLPLIMVVTNETLLVQLIRLTGFEEQLRVETLLSGSGRFFAWQFALDTFAAYPWLGRGFAYEEILFHDYMPQWLYATGHQGGVHNSYIAFLLNNGVIGLTLVLLFYILLIRRIPVRRYIPAIIISTAFSAFFEPWLSSSLNAFTVHMLLLILFYTHLSRQMLHLKPSA
ncbi:MAG: hypothetical protein OHK0039_47230 [Bacteroidia bacterium]